MGNGNNKITQKKNKLTKGGDHIITIIDKIYSFF